MDEEKKWQFCKEQVDAFSPNGKEFVQAYMRRDPEAVKFNRRHNGTMIWEVKMEVNGFEVVYRHFEGAKTNMTDAMAFNESLDLCYHRLISKELGKYSLI